MECPRCRHVSCENAPIFCSQCGQRLVPAAPVPDSENNNSLVGASAPEGKMEQEEALKEEEALPMSPGSREGQEDPDDGTWTVQMEEATEVAVDASEDTADELEGAEYPPCKRRKDAAGFEISDAEQSKKKKKKKKIKGQSAPTPTSLEPSSLSSMSSGPWSLDLPSIPASRDSALPQSQAQHGSPSSQPSQSLAMAEMPLEEDSSVLCAAGSGPLQGQTAGSAEGKDGGVGDATQNSPDPSTHTEVKGLNSSKPPADKGFSQEGGCDPTPSASRGHPKAKATDVTQKVPVPESKVDKSEPQDEEPAVPRQPASRVIDATAEPVSPANKARKETEEARKLEPPPVSSTASKGLFQEAEPKGQSAVTVQKTGENENVKNRKPEDQKKADGNRNYAATVKNKTEQKAAPEALVRMLSAENGVTVYFHAIVSKHFAFDADVHRVFVRGGEELGRKGWTDACEMYYSKDLHDLGSLIEGSLVIPRQSLDKNIPYKYVIHHRGSKDTVEYEFIYEDPQKKGEHVNRCLCVRSALLGAGDWHQYDDIICRKPGKIQKAVDIITDGTRKDLVRGKKEAAVVMLDRVFSVLHPWSAINLESFMTQFQQFYSVVREPVIYERCARPWKSLQLEEKEVKTNLWEHVKNRMVLLLEGKSGDSLSAAHPERSRLSLGLAILFMVEAVDFAVPKSGLHSLCRLLIPSAASSDALRTDLSPVLSKPHRWRIYLINLCQRCMDQGVNHWLGILPILHYCMQLPLPREDSVSRTEDTWAGLEGLSFAHFREKSPTKSQLIQFIEQRQSLLHVDEYLFRSWFTLVPLESLISYLENSMEYLSHVPARVLDCFQGISYRLQGMKISYLNLGDVKKVFKMLLHLVDIYQDTILGGTPLQTYLAECLNLHETVCKITTNERFYQMPALSAEIICQMLRLKPSEDAAEGPGAEVSEVPTSVLQETLAITRKWLRSVFKSRMFSLATGQFTYSEEMAVWRRLVEINFPGTHGWKESLLGDLERRFKQEYPRLRISVFCSNQWDHAGLHDSVARIFEKSVIEAVSSACQSQTSILEGLYYQDLRKFGTLLSAVITKSWPRNNGEAVVDLDEIFKYLLVWPDVKQLFKLCGTDEKLLANMTEEGRNLMAVAESVFRKVAGDLVNGTIAVGQLELILEHSSQFTDIWHLNRKSLSFQDIVCDVKNLLTRRNDDLQFLKRERRYVESFLRQCGMVKHHVQVDFGEIEAIHSEDLSRKKLNEAVIVALPDSSATERMTHYCLSPETHEMASKIDALKDSHVFQILWQEAAGELRDSDEDSKVLELDLPEAYECLYCPCYAKFLNLYEDLKSGEITFAEVDNFFRDFVDKYGDLTADLQAMCTVDPHPQKSWIPQRVVQIKEYHSLHQAVSSAKVMLQVRSTLGLTGDFSVLDTLLNFTDAFEEFRHEKLDQISLQLIQAKKLLQGISEPRHRCLKELSLQTKLVDWLREALGGINELKVFVDLASISAGENDIDVDRVACFHDAVQGYASLLYKLDTNAGFCEFMDHLQELWRALDNDQHLPSKLRDSARNLEWLKTVKESHGSVELSSLSLATAINSRGIYVIETPKRGQNISLDTVLYLILPEDHGVQEMRRNYSAEELKELLNKLMLMSGKKDHNSNVEVEKFSEVFSNVQRLVHAFINLHCAGNMLFRTWTAEVYCCPRQGVSIRIDFHLGLVKQLTGSGDVIELLGALCRQMEHFLDRWKTFVTQKRAEHFYLNFYTAEQLVYLSSELRKPSPSEAALMMLSFIKRNCTAHDILEVTRFCDGKTAKHCQRDWVEMYSECGLVGKLQAIMEQSRVCKSTFLPDCLDLDTLGCCLAQLARMGGPPVQRPLPKGLQAGQPNLVLCGHSEVLPAALAIYVQAPGQPLPTFDEVLLCTPGTTLEEVELLLRRCLTLGSQGHKVYSLLFADRLSYEVGCQAEVLFQKLCTQRHREDYQLVIVCDAAREHCCIPSIFSQYKVLLVPQAPLLDIQTYLENHYQVPRQTRSAAEVFRDRMCVGIVTSERAGVGKSLYVTRLHEKLKTKLDNENVPLKIIRLTDSQVDENRVLSSLLPFLKKKYQKMPVIFHIDVTTSVQTGISGFLFKLLILQYLMDISGKMWHRNPCHLYVVEILQGNLVRPRRTSKQTARAPSFSFLDIFPKVTCHPPKEVINMELTPERSHREPGMDHMEFCSEAFQRPYQYLKRFHQKQNLDVFQYQEGSVEGSPEECLQYFLIYCGMINPSWSELRNFARFLNCQLKDCEASVFCNSACTGDALRGFKNFVVTFMIFMARDFATPTLHTSDQSPGKHLVTMDGVAEEDLAPFSLRKRWESEPHPYVFFNGDRMTMTFIGFHLQSNDHGYVDAINHLTGKVLKKDVMTKELFDELRLQRVPFNIDFDNLPRHEKLERLCLALGIEWPSDPDETYELTTDNMLKILAIEMRFRCGIPVIIMGETGCGKTRLIKFLSDLRNSGVETETMKLVKVHGGTSASMIYSKVKEAQSFASSNKVQHELDTILFFDEANTTEAVSCIKEVLCDRTVDGEHLKEDSGLHIIAACNPYRKHSQEMILRLESAGLGYRVSAEETADRLGSIPLRQLVYRVHALPPSLIPLVWDFGQLNDAAEKLYIQQIVQRLVNSISINETEMQVITGVLSTSQRFMRKRENECGFVSLRDVERCVKVFRWFHDHSEMLLDKLNAFLGQSGDSSHNFKRDPVLWSLVMATGVCYHASLEEKESYRAAIGRCFPVPYNDSKVILDEITQVQDLFLSGAPIRTNIARNLALKENVFMMVICIDLKIPLFLVGKPGSSKSLAKIIVADAMQGQAAYSDLFRCLKQVHLVSFQCSPHSTPQGIIGTFKQCARFQQGKDLQQYVSVVVLDEVGLAEDSPKMPLKTLHPLLEDGCIEDDPAPHKKVGFVGISNWALDPAKMNRGIFVSRGSPSEKELIESAEGICSSDRLVQDRIRGYFAPFAKAYETVCQTQDKEFFGLRDYYSLIKMVFAKAKASNREPSPQDIAHAVLRNFSGKDDIQALDIFTASLPEARYTEEVSTVELIKQNINSGQQRASGGEQDSAEARYLLVLTRNYVALQILQQKVFRKDQHPEIIFGSSFPQDQEYTQICKNINRVKICMETGKMVVLLNLQSLYESLYDALNQYYVYLGGQKYVDLGLGTHRVKCRVHANFRLIVIEEKDVVYEQFPVPLINRLEKHYLDINTVLEGWQKSLMHELAQWASEFADTKGDPFLSRHKYSPADVFVGYHSDACASVVLQAVEGLGPGDLSEEMCREVAKEAKLILLDCATPDAVVRRSGSSLDSFAAEYYYRQQHNSFADFLQAHLRTTHPQSHAVFTEITTFSRLLTSHDCEVLESELAGLSSKPMVLSLEQFDTEYSFLKEVRTCLTNTARCKILIIQTDFDDGVHSAQLIASAKYSAINEINKTQGTKDRVFVYFITKLSRMGSGAAYVGFHGGLWRSVHIDDLRRSTLMASDVTKLQSVTISQLFKPADKPEPESGGGSLGILAGDPEEEMETETSKPGEVAEEEMEVESPEEMEHKASDPGGCDVPQCSQVLDTTRLLRSCVQSAVGMLRDQNESCARNMRRVTILLGLLSEDSTCSAYFLRVSKMRLHVLLKKQEENQVRSLKEWVTREAANQDALQEAGTFRHTLWKRVQGVVTPFLASMISYIDRDGNLELLDQPESPAWVRELWMFIFSDIKFLNIPLVMNNTRSKTEMSSILVQSHMNLFKNACNAVPFSWRIRDFLEELWVQAQYITDTEGLSKKLVEIFQKTPLGKFLAQLPVAQQQELLQCYMKDFLLLTLRVSSREQLKFLQMALWSCLSEFREASRVLEEGLSLPWVHLAYQHFRTRLQNFSRILTIHPQVLHSLTEAAQKHDLVGCEMILDAFAAMACVEMLKRDILKPSPQAWLQLVKTLSMPLELICSDGYLQDSGNMTKAVIQGVRAQWNRIFSIALFVDHVLLGTESQVPELTQLVTKYVFLLDKCLEEDPDIKTFRPFKAVMTTLCECKDKASKTLTRFGVQPCPICLGDAWDPVCLPCEHVFCLPCIKAWLIPGQMMCPYCLTDVSDTFSPTVSQEHRKVIEKHAQFRQMCNSFFVDLVSTMCFKDNTPPQKAVIHSLLSLLFVQKELLRDTFQTAEHREHTKSLSPFDDVIDKTPIIRSVVLKLLLKYSFHEVKGYIQDYLSQLENKAFLAEDKTELYLLFINCLEDSVHEKRSSGCRSNEQSRLREEGCFLRTCSPGSQGQEPATAASVDYLQEVARVRLCLDWAADFLSELQEGSELAEDKQCFLKHVEQFCNRVKNDWHRVYLVRTLSSQRGMEFVQNFSRPGHPCQWVFPRDVIAQQKDHPGQMDRYLVHGHEYKALRDAMGKAVLECKTLDIGAALTACRSSRAQQTTYLLLALYREVAVLYRSHNANLHPKPEQCEAVNRFIEESKILSAPNVRHLAKSLVANDLPLLRRGSNNSSLEGTVAEMAIHAAAIFLCGQNKVLEPLRNLAFYPANMANAFLPTMPEDLLVQAKSWKGLGKVHWYTCPNGHPCSVGECGMPMEQSFCVDCGIQIGGLSHVPNKGFEMIKSNEDRTQTGHVLGNPQPVGAAVASDRGLSPVVFILTRLLTHLALLLGATQNREALMEIIKPQVQDPQGFLQQHIQRDLEQLTKMLGKTADETTHVVHLVLCRFLKEQHPVFGQRTLNFNAELSTKGYRNNWEKHVEALLLPELEHLDKTLPTVNALISQDERISSNPVAKIIYGDPATFLPHLPQKSVVHCSKIWSCKKKITVEYLQHIVEQKNGKEAVPVLWKFLQKEAELRLVKFLPEILALQRDLVKQFQNASEDKYSSISGFISSHRSDGLRKLFHDRIAIFLSTWNALRRSLETNGEIKLHTDYCHSDLDLDADFEVILPRRQGPGLCSTALVSYLISLHNEMVYTVEKFSKENNSYSVDASEVADLHVISYEVERDLTPLILSNCQYQVQQGGETSQEFDLEKIQRQISSRFLQGKPRLTLKGIPTLVYRRDWNYEHLFMDIKNKMTQNPLPSSAISAISGQLQSYSDTCEALSITEVTLSFLSTAGGDPGMDLKVYIQDSLQMGDQTTLVLKALNRCQLRHTIALWQFLSAYKSEQRLRLKKEPFQEISVEYKKDLSQQHARLLSTFLNEASLDAFLLELHEMIVLKLRRPQAEGSFNPKWSLRDTLVSYMETKESDVLPEVEFQFPEEIPMSNCISVWKAAATQKLNRQAR
ncbi:E3 ubiquitin-protein ligase RNF213 isoform X2 [Nannospalax galili]|uniref:E3 ubiquitin-protein ligase RNF213 isoform X2 n=1 Tax=Nannospalax galili TaxID=1026970 RepID=UPI00111C32F4|nr:E3 ubiquitin-protein ligase RNF213 isoform X2 [Nannospalax galili]